MAADKNLYSRLKPPLANMDILIKAAIITVSDSRRAADDISGRRLAAHVASAGGEIVEMRIVPDDLQGLRDLLNELTENEEINLILTSGGTGFGPRDNTPEATRTVIEREAPGIAEAIRRESAVKSPMAILSRAVAGIRGRTLIINLPGSPKAVDECFEVIRPVLHHAINLIGGKTKH